MSWKTLCELTEIPQRGARVVIVKGIEVAVFRTSDDSVFAVRDRCPHRGGPLSQGIVYDNSVACPLHNWKIDLATGNAKEPDVGCVKTYSVKVENGRVLMDTESVRDSAGTSIQASI